MYKTVRKAFDEIREDKAYFWLLIAIVGLAAVYILFTLLSIRNSDIQLINHYSGLGDTHFYKAKWYSLYEFTLFGLIVGVMNVVMLSRLKLAGRRNVGIVIGWITLLVLVLAFIYTYQVLHLAYL